MITGVRGELHLKDGMAAVKEHVTSGKVVRPAPVQMEGGKNRHAPLIAAPYFVVDMFEAEGAAGTCDAVTIGHDSVQILVAVEGCGVIEAAGHGSGHLAKGDAVVVPAGVGNFGVRPQWAVEFLRAYVPGKPLPSRKPECRIDCNSRRSA